MQDKKISINCIDKTIVVDGVAHHCPDMSDWMEGTRAIQWDKSSGARLPGSVESQDSHRFSDFALVEHYLPAWQRADEEAKQIAAAKKRESEAEEAKIKALKEAGQQEAAAMEADTANRAKHDEALNLLCFSDWKIIRAMEAKLAADGQIDPDLVKLRANARKVVELERKKL